MKTCLFKKEVLVLKIVLKLRGAAKDKNASIGIVYYIFMTTLTNQWVEFACGNSTIIILC